MREGHGLAFGYLGRNASGLDNRHLNCLDTVNLQLRPVGGLLRRLIDRSMELSLFSVQCWLSDEDS